MFCLGGGRRGQLAARAKQRDRGGGAGEADLLNRRPDEEGIEQAVNVVARRNGADDVHHECAGHEEADREGATSFVPVREERHVARLAKPPTTNKKGMTSNARLTVLNQCCSLTVRSTSNAAAGLISRH